MTTPLYRTFVQGDGLLTDEVTGITSFDPTFSPTFVNLTLTGDLDVGGISDFTGDLTVNTNAFVVDASAGRIYVNTPIASWVETGFTIQSHIYVVEDDSGSRSGLTVSMLSDNVGRNPSIDFLKAKAGLAAVADNDDLGDISFLGFDGTDYNPGCRIVARIDGTPAANTVPTELLFQTTETNNPLNRMVIKPDGKIGMGTPSPQELLALVGNLVLPKTSGNGIKVDNTTPTFGFRDILGNVTQLNIGASKPNFTTYRDTLKQFEFAVGEEEYFEFHIPHDHVAGTDVFLHIHWSHTSAIVTGGSVTFEYEISYAKSHDQGAFPASVTGTIAQNASTTQYQHQLAEGQVSASTPSGSQVDTDDLTPDGVILCRVELQANNITSSGAVPDPFIHYVDLHYQSTNIATKDKVPDFYA